MKCIECKKIINVLDEKCPYCGANQYDDVPTKEPTAIQLRRGKKEKKPMFSEEKCLVYGIHPNDETYRKVMELNVLSKNY